MLIQHEPARAAVVAYVQRDPSGAVVRGCVMHAGLGMPGFVLRLLARDTSQPFEVASIDEALTGAGGRQKRGG